MAEEMVLLSVVPSFPRLPPISTIQNLGNWGRAIPCTRASLARRHPFGFRSLTCIQAGQGFGLVDEAPEKRSSGDWKTVSELKTALYQALQGINRGIFGVPSAKKSEIEDLVKLLESQNPTPGPTESLEKVEGSWKLVYTTISILGMRRTKLGLRDFLTLGDFFQFIDVSEAKAVNVIKFSARGLKMFAGQLVIVASFKIATKSRVDIKFENSSIAPEQLLKIFQTNYDMLLAIFNPEGWLEITYVDESIRIGRDDKGNVFILERSEMEKIEDCLI